MKAYAGSKSLRKHGHCTNMVTAQTWRQAHRSLLGIANFVPKLVLNGALHVVAVRLQAVASINTPLHLQKQCCLSLTAICACML